MSDESSDRGAQRPGGAFRRWQQSEARNRKVITATAAVIGIAAWWLMDPGNWKGLVALIFVLAIGYAAAARRDER